MKLKYSLTFLTCLALSKFSTAQTPSFNWVGSIGGTQSHANAIMSDTSGNVFTYGYFGGFVDLNPGTAVTTLTASGSQDAFLIKQDAAGNFLWAKQFGGVGADIGTAMDIDAAGNLYLTGEFRNVVDFDPGAGTFTLATTATSIINMFVLKLTNSGNFVWAKQIGDGVESLPSPTALSLDPSGNVYSCGVFKDTTDFDPGVATFTMGSTGTTAFILKLDNSGNFGWAKQVAATSAITMDTDAGGNVITAGIFSATVDFDPGSATVLMTSIGLNDGFILKLNSAGNYVWVKQLGGTTSDVITNLKTDCYGNIVSIGTFSSNLRANPSSTVNNFTTFGSNDIFVSKLDANGSYVWAQQIGGTSIDLAYALMIDNAGEIYLTGSYGGGATTSGSADFDPGTGTQTLSSVGASDIFLLKLTGVGSYAWAYSMGNTDVETGYAIYVDQLYRIYTAGDFMGTVDFNPFAPVANQTAIGNPFGVYILKFSQPVVLPPVNTTPNVFGGQKSCVNLTTTLTATGSGTLVWFAANTPSNALNSGTAFVTPQLSVNTTFYVHSINYCGFATSLTPVSVTVNALPTISVAATKTFFCKGEPQILTASGGSSYLWSNGKTTTTVSVITQTATVFSVVGTNSNSCSNSVSVTVTPNACIGISEQSTSKTFVIYPNPAQSEFIIESTEATNLFITNEMGQHLKTIHVDAAGQSRVQTDLAPGIYYIHSKSRDVTKTQKLVIVN